MKIGMMIHTGVHEFGGGDRKTLSGMERLLYSPRFGGEINGGADYIIVDDIVTQGGTVSALRKHIIFNKGSVAAVTALAYSADSGRISPDIQDIHNLIEKFTYASLNAVLRRFNIADDIWELTRSQVRYLLRFKKMENIIKCMSKSKDRI